MICQRPVTKKMKNDFTRLCQDIDKRNVKQMTNQRFEIVWPEHRYVSVSQIRTWYADAVANGETEGGLTDPEEMARELSSIGHITLGKGRS